MSRKKVIISLLLALIMCFSLVGCGGGDVEKPQEDTKRPGDFQGAVVGNQDKTEATATPSVEELMANIPTIDSSKYYSIEVGMETSGKTDDTEASFGFSMCMEGNGALCHLYDTSMEFELEGVSMAVDMESWVDLLNKVEYSRASFFGEDSGWSKADLEVEEDPVESFKRLFDTLIRVGGEDRTPTLRGHSGKEDWVVTWDISPEVLREALASMGDISGEDPESIDVSAINAVNVDATFDWTTKEFKSISVVGSGKGSQVAIRIAIYAVNGSNARALKIPDEVLNNAVEDGMSHLDMGLGLDEGSIPAYGEETSASPTGNAVNTEEYQNDGLAYDEAIDGAMVSNILSGDPNHRLRVYHYEGVTSLYWGHDEDEWFGSVEVDHITENGGWYDKKQEYEDAYDFRIDLYGEDALLEGSRDSGKCAIGTVDNGSISVYLIFNDGDYCVTAHACQYTGGTYDSVKKTAIGMLAIAGLDY